MTNSDEYQEFVIVDGYNVVYAWESLRKLAARDIDAARDKLLSRLANFAGFKRIGVIAVFDAHRVAGGVEKTDTNGGLTVVFTKEKETADSYIERAAPRISKSARVYVATDDLTEQFVIMGRAIRLSTADLLAEVKAAERGISDKISQNRPIKNNLFIDNVSRELAQWMEARRLDSR